MNTNALDASEAEDHLRHVPRTSSRESWQAASLYPSAAFALRSDSRDYSLRFDNWLQPFLVSRASVLSVAGLRLLASEIQEIVEGLPLQNIVDYTRLRSF